MESRLDALWSQHSDNVKGTLVGLTRNADLAEDLAQDTYLRARAGFATCRGDNDLAWLNTIARNTFLSHARRAWVHSETPLEEDCDGGCTLDAGSSSHVDQMDLNRAMSLLPCELHSVLRMRYLTGLSYAEIAELEQISLRTAKWRVKKAALLLRSFLYMGGESDATTCAELTTARLLDYIYRLLPPGRYSATTSHT